MLISLLNLVSDEIWLASVIAASEEIALAEGEVLIVRMKRDIFVLVVR